MCAISSVRSAIRDRFLVAGALRLVLIFAAMSLTAPSKARAQACTNAPSGLVAWYRGEGNANDSAGAANAIFFNPAYAAGEVGQAFSFNGTSSFAEIPVVPALNFTNNTPVSIEFWAYRTGTATTMELLGKRGSACGAIQYEISLTPGAGLAFDTAGGSLPTGFQLPTNVWVHLAVTFDGTNILFYTNAVLAASGTGQLGAANGAPVYLGTSSSCPGFVGLLDEISFYNRALSASELQGIFAAGSAGKCLLVPSITTQPQSQSVLAGTSATFSVVAVGGAPLSYQWFFGGTNLAGATTSSLVLTNVQSSNAGSYFVLVTNAAGSVVSSNALLSVVSCDPAPPGLVAWWNGEGTAADSVGINNGSLINGVTFASGEVGNAFVFNGTDSYVQVPDAPNLNFGPTSPLTIELWAYKTGTESVMHFIGKRGAGCSANIEYQMAFDSNGLSFSGSSGGGVVTGVQMPTNVWIHLAGTFDGTTFRYYTNGVLVGTGTGTLGPMVSDPLTIGTSGGCPYFAGLIDEVSIYDRALSAAEIQAIYAAGSLGKCGRPPAISVQPQSQSVATGQNVSFVTQATGSSPLGYQWSLNGTNIANATNTSLMLTNVGNSGVYVVQVTNAYGSVFSSNASLSVSVPVCVPAASDMVSWWAGEGNANDNFGTNNGTILGGASFTNGIVGQAFNFDGTIGTVIVPDAPGLRFIYNLTIEAWINPAVTNGSVDIVSKLGGAAGNNGYEFALVGNSLLGQFNSPGLSWPSAVVNAPLSIIPGTWNHVAFTYDQSVMSLYFNGQLVATNAIGPAIINHTNNNLRIGSNENNSEYFDGQIDEVAVYSRALAASEIHAIYNAYTAGRCPIAPSFLAQPQSQTNLAGQNIVLTVFAHGSNPFSYQWIFDGTNLPGATSSSLVLTNVQPGNSGQYSIVASNSAGAVASSNATLTVVVPNCDPAPTNLVGWWAGEGNAYDNTGLNNGTLQGGVGFARGVVGQAFQFNGNNGIVLVPDSISLEISNQLTIEAWINVQRTNGSQVLVGKVQSASGNNGYEFGLTGNSLFGQFNSPGLQWPSAQVFYPMPIALGTWNHVAFTYDQSAMKLYLNGQPVATNVVGPAIINSVPGSDLCIGGEWINHTVYFEGLVDEASVYNTALSTTQIQAIYNAFSAGKCSFPPTFVTQPLGRTVKPGINTVFTASAAGGNPLAYQWLFDGSVLPGATNSSLTLTNVQASSAGAYSLIASNSVGSVTSSNAVLKVEIITVLGNGQVLSNAQYTFGGQVTIQLQNYYTNGDMFYTLDGSIPSFSATPYAGPFVVNQSAILQVLGYDPDFVESGYSDPIMLSFIPAFTLTATTPGGGSILVNPTNSPYVSNSVVGLTASASNGWSFLQWAGDASGTSLTNSVLMNSNKHVQALFGTSLSVTSSPGGSVLRSPSAALYPYGMSVQISALPQTNNFFALWGNAASGNLNPLYFALTNPNPIVSALFVGLGSNQVSLSVVPVGHGKVAVVPQANVFTNGQSVQITATPDTNHTFLGWSGDATGAQNPLTVSMISSKTIYANFTKNYSFGFTPPTGLGLRPGFQLDLTGEIPVAYRFDASTNLTNWLPLITLTNYTGTLQYTDTNAINFNLRFYRGVPLL